MGVRHFTELRAWQLANRLTTEIYDFTSVPPASDDRRFCDDIRASSRSICSNLSEGFGRYTHSDFARFVTIARGSLVETQNHLIHARDRRYLRTDDFEKMWELSTETLRVVTGLQRYLRTCPARARST